MKTIKVKTKARDTASIDDVIRMLDKLKVANPRQKIVVETPSGCVELQLGDALIYEDGYGNLVIDSE